MCKAIQVLRIATNISHIMSPSQAREGLDEASCSGRAAGVAALFFATLLTCGVGGGYLIHKAHWKLEHGRQHSLAVIEEFWHQHIEPLELSHGTTSLYQSHFQRHGISHRYPAPLANVITKIRKVWSDHAHQIPKTGYWELFEERYDHALANQRVAVSFSADPRVTEEYTKGARGYGGEWMRELRFTFIPEVLKQRELFSAEELEIISDADTLSDVMHSVPPMVVKMPMWDLPWHVRLSVDVAAPIMPLDSFVAHVQSQTEWLNPRRLRNYLTIHALPTIERVYKHYEIPISHPIPAEKLRYEVGSMPRFRRDLSRSPFTEREKHWLRAFGCERFIG